MCFVQIEPHKNNAIKKKRNFCFWSPPYDFSNVAALFDICSVEGTKMLYTKDKTHKK